MQLPLIPPRDPTIVTIPPFFIALYRCCVVTRIQASKVMCDRIKIVEIRWLLTLTNHNPCSSTTRWQGRRHVVGQIQCRVGREGDGCVDLVREWTLKAKPFEVNEKDLRKMEK